MLRSRRHRPGDGLPGTLRRSCREAQEAFALAYRAAFTALKQGFEKRGDHWIAKHELPG